MNKDLTDSLDALDQSAIADALVGLVGQREPGLIHPDSVIKAARAASHPLHNYFTWDNTQAAQLWRREQATYVIQRVERIWASRPPRVIHSSNGQKERGQKILQLPTVTARPTRSAGRTIVTPSVANDDDLADARPTRPRFTRSDLSDPVQRVAVLYQALEDFVTLQNRYGFIPELSEVRIAIGSYAKKIADVKRRCEPALRKNN